VSGGPGGASGAPGSPVPGAAGGTAGSQPSPNGGAGASANGASTGATGGGGGGLVGGGGGGGGHQVFAGSGGGGGSSLTPAGGTLTDGVNTGDGQVTISYNILPAQVAALQQTVQGVGPGTSLTAKLTTAQQDLAAGNVADTCDALTGFVHQVQAQAGKKIPPATADQLVASAQQIQAEIGC
jgi:hypothetical protein